MRKRDFEALMGSRLFSAVPEALALRWTGDPRARQMEAEKGVVMLSSSELHRSLAVILRGTATVYKRCEDGRRVIMSRLGAGDQFGMATLFYESDEVPTEVEASSDCRILVLPKDMVEDMLDEYPPLARAYITLLSERIHFLGRRMGTFAESDATERLAGVLGGFWECGDTLKIPFSMTELAKVLGVGRASLYRAMDALEREEAVVRKGNTVTVLTPERLGIHRYSRAEIE